MPTIYEQLRADIVTAMKARDGATATSLRTADAGIQRASMDLSKPIDDALVIGTLRKAVKNLADAKVEFERGGRADLVPVSYTHLDVYKRQSSRSACSGSGGGPPSGWPTTKP